MSVEENQDDRASKAGVESEIRRCDYCGTDFTTKVIAHAERRKYCSSNCQRKASHGRTNSRLPVPTSKRYAARIRFSNPLYFD